MVRRLLLPVVLLVAASAGGADAGRQPIYADQVGHASVVVTDSSYEGDLDCAFNSGGVVDDVTSVATEFRGGFNDGWMPTSTDITTHRSNSGHLIQVGDDQIVFEERKEEEHDRHGFARGWAVAGDTPGSIAHVAVALWGGTVRDCLVVIDGQVAPMTWYPGRYAFYAGPEAFTGGLF